MEKFFGTIITTIMFFIAFTSTRLAIQPNKFSVMATLLVFVLSICGTTGSIAGVALYLEEEKSKGFALSFISLSILSAMVTAGLMYG